jgi:translation initiation factor IF-1
MDERAMYFAILNQKEILATIAGHKRKKLQIKKVKIGR